MMAYQQVGLGSRSVCPGVRWLFRPFLCVFIRWSHCGLEVLLSAFGHLLGRRGLMVGISPLWVLSAVLSSIRVRVSWPLTWPRDRQGALTHLSWVVSVVVNWQGVGLLTCMLSLWVLGVYATFMASAVLLAVAFVVHACLLAVDVAAREVAC